MSFVKSFIQEFKTFAIRGSVIDLAVGTIIGAAFGKIVTSVINDLIMPPIGMAIGGTKFNNLKIVLKRAYKDGAGTDHPEVAIMYGNFIQTALDFTILAFIIFVMVKAINKLKRKQEEAAPPAEPTNEEKLLTEIRDLLKNKQ